VRKRRLTRLVKVLRTFPDLQDEANVAEALVHNWSAFEGAPEDVWTSMGDDRKDVEEATGSALEVSLEHTLTKV
jgi:hypothetical protein